MKMPPGEIEVEMKTGRRVDLPDELKLGLAALRFIYQPYLHFQNRQ